MDNKDSTSIKNKTFKGSPVTSSISDNVENVFTSTPNQSLGFVPVNGPRGRLMNNEFGQSGSLSDNADTFRNLAGTSQSQMCRVNSNNDTETTASSSSKTSSSAYDNGTESNQDGLPCPKRMSGNSCTSSPSTSGLGKAGDNADYNSRESRKRPSSLRLNRSNLDADDSSSDTGNDDYSLGSKDGCIYTYRGGEHLADLPSSFFSLDMGLPLDKHLPLPPNYPVPHQGNREHGSRASSPDMDFLEMDFDPVPSCEVDTGEESTSDVELDATSNMSEEIEPGIRRLSPEYLGGRYNPVNLPSVSNLPVNVNISYDQPSTSDSTVEKSAIAESSCSYGIYIAHVNARGEQILVRRTMAHWPVSLSASVHLSSGDVVSGNEMSQSMYNVITAKKLAEVPKSDTEHQAVGSSGDEGLEACITSSVSSTGGVEPPRSMVWSEREACERQVTQIGTSACGATAVVNAFTALGVPVNLEKINSAVGTRLRADNAPIPRYILSRAVAGCTAADLVNGIQSASDGLITARFFPTYPERAVSLSHWLADWISLGAVPILTLNLQVGCTGEIPDAWHHQMVFGVSPQGVYLCNPMECVRENALWARLTSPSVLLVRARDVLARFTPNTDLTPLTVVPDRRFHTFNVLGQVVNVIREWRASGWSEQGTRTRHIRVPAAYQPGITLAALTGSEAHIRLNTTPQLPILGPQTNTELDKRH